MKTPPRPGRPMAHPPTLFAMPAEPAPPPVRDGPPPVGVPRLRMAVRDQVVFRAAALDDLIPPEHPVRAIWEYVVGLDLSPLHDRIKAVQGRPGRSPIDPRILLALWLYATTRGVGSARQLDALCRSEIAYQWIVGDVSVNYHTIADFRTDHAALLDDLLTKSVALLMAEGLVDLERVAQDGMRVRASAGAASFRRQPTLEEALAEAHAQVEALRQELEDDPKASDRRQRQARQRAARERSERVAAALNRLPELESKKPADEKDKARCSTTDPEATVMKMANGGFNPAFNVQFATDTKSQVIVGVDVITSGSDQGQMGPMVEQIRDRYDRVPGAMLVDGGFAKHDDIDAVGAPEVGCTVYAPVQKPKVPQTDRHAPSPRDSARVAEWRQRMGTDEAKAIYKDRAATAECVNALARRRGLLQFLVRGVSKVRTIALWHALAHNVLRMKTLRAAVLAGSAG
jgi:transposase